LLLRLGAGDPEPEVLMECVRGLFALAPDLAVPAARGLLEADDARRRELVLSALGTAPHDEAVILLMEALSAQTLASDRKAIIDALGLSLRPRARAFLIELAGSERTSDAHAALEALSIHRYDARLVAALRARTAQVPALAARFAALFSD
jgi:HEAT repeat protein